jgi:hypothetical protein
MMYEQRGLLRRSNWTALRQFSLASTTQFSAASEKFYATDNGTK